MTENTAPPGASSPRAYSRRGGFPVHRRNFHRGRALHNAAQAKPAVFAPPQRRERLARLARIRARCLTAVRWYPLVFVTATSQQALGNPSGGGA